MPGFPSRTVEEVLNDTQIDNQTDYGQFLRGIFHAVFGNMPLNIVLFDHTHIRIGKSKSPTFQKDTYFKVYIRLT